MKNIKKILHLAAGFMLLLTACTEKDIEVTPTRELKEDFYKKTENVSIALATTYN